MYLHEREQKLPCLHSRTHSIPCWKHQKVKHGLLNDHKMSGKSTLQLYFSRTFPILILSHLEVHSLIPLAFSHLSALLGSSCFVCQHKILFSWGLLQPLPFPTAKSSTKHLFCFAGIELLDKVWISYLNSGWGKSPMIDEVLSGLASLITH